jgi:hypothetical protein
MPEFNESVKMLSNKTVTSSPPYLMTDGGMPSGPGLIVGLTNLRTLFISLTLMEIFDSVLSGESVESTGKDIGELAL